MNKCEELKLAHAWRGTDLTGAMVGFSVSYSEVCANCDLKRTKCSKIEEWWSFSDGRADEDIINIRPV
jgi:hypothetical protein